MAIIKLKYGGAGGRYNGVIFEALIDDEYQHFLSKFPWRLHNDHGRKELKKAYVICDVSNRILPLLSDHPQRAENFGQGHRPKLRLHRLIYCHHNGIDEGAADFVIDHINGNALDNRLVNLRKATTAQNNYNKRGQRRNMHGIYKVADGYRAQIMHDGKHVRSLAYKTIREAKLAYDELAKKYQGSYAVLHFPEGDSNQLDIEGLSNG